MEKNEIDELNESFQLWQQEEIDYKKKIIQNNNYKILEKIISISYIVTLNYCYNKYILSKNIILDKYDLQKFIIIHYFKFCFYLRFISCFYNFDSWCQHGL